jgi:ATP-dependent DNA helicase DinG
MTVEEIENKIEEFRVTFLGETWVWRKGQKEAIIEIILTYFEKKYDTVILDAPVGSGKSSLAMCTSWILNQEGKRGYILASDISLQEQYEKDFKRFNLNWGSIKGLDNYTCIDNMEKTSQGTCKIRNLIARNMACYDQCPYYIARDHASSSKTSLLNYAYWLIHENYVNFIVDKPLFPPRQFLFADEGHKILDIVQNNYSPRFDSKTLEKLDKITKFFKTYKVRDHDIDYLDIKDAMVQLWVQEDQNELYNQLVKIGESLKKYLDSIESLKERIKKDYPKDKPPREWREAVYISSWLSDFEYKIDDYNKIIEATSSRNIVKNPQGEDIIVFNCLKESYLMHKYFHRWTGFRIFMSATFADPSDYLRSLSLKGAKYIKVQSSFDFTKSPIYYYNKRKMSYRNIEANLPWLCSKINEIIENHKGESGIIHSASYDLTMKIFQNLTPKNRKRVLIYNGTEEKRKVLEMLKEGRDKILMGPSLTHGLDLKDDWARFSIIAKISYPSLMDKFVSAKLKIDPKWYQWKTIIELIQALGRTVRNEDDWAITYILDGSLGDLIHNSRRSFPPEFMQRLKVIPE